MRIKTLALASAWALASLPTLAQEALPVAGPAITPQASQTPQSLQALSLAEVWRLAEEANPTLRIKRAEITAAEGARTDARALLYNNPVLDLGATRRQVPQDGLPSARTREWAAGVQQTLEIAGQRGHRRDAAEAALRALQEEITDVRTQVRVDVSQFYFRVLALQQRIELEQEALGLFERTAAAIQKRRTAGEDTKLDANVAAVEAERARNQLALARENLLDARAELAARLQLPPERLPQASGDLGVATTPAPYSLADLLSQAETQPRLRALGAREASARSRLKLENARRYPDLTVGISTGREGMTAARERLSTVTLTVPLPLFNRNATGIGQASTQLTQAEISRIAAVRDVQAQVQALWTKLESLRTRVSRLQDVVLPALLDNQQLSLKSRQAGQIGLLELIVVNRQALDARRDLNDALIDYQITRLALELAAGWSPEGVTP
ncbi:TolC family protein [Variovorax sp. NFACC27]|uniref:TolC family protein n=1 Tax=unclassified Variovorax TaxID=663243 RepID=UPI0008952679|nr:outer membrane protein, cobalt-zinc-cadmium efflux system [Variovorax sp. NFACC28]SEG99001.1 outer membrane protein, cobalt-zinc-cadmium efflux system [Variovorax sp. NFACC29]SFE16441.1 outer membrane protein, cobalt-zinc-cadmium efflux system [Variovorax sp. NFACC26]SFH06839.1 outer membrane protein, cobalt-zinc-cadmium efflux system [Variovorax sp. NFACC27]SEF35242.1 outer membrane protein, cobalt-zinc-cadmium efflux system [Variovorax sp. NFACC28]